MGGENNGKPYQKWMIWATTNFWKHPYGQVNLIGGGDFCNYIISGQLFPTIPEPELFRAFWGHFPYFKLFTTTSLRFVRFEETVSAVSFVFSQQVETHPGGIHTTTKWLGAVLKTVKQKMEDSNSVLKAPRLQDAL